MNEILNAISVVGFPIVMCGVLCYYIFKTQTALITAINNNSLEIAKLIEEMEESDNEETQIHGGNKDYQRSPYFSSI